MSIDLSKMPKLGFGLMRLPELNGEIDHEQVCQMVDLYMKAGLTYFDTAYVYHHGMSEAEVRRAIVERYPRDSFTVATKLPVWEMKCKEDRDRIFNEQLERTGAGYFDFYLLHAIDDGSYNDYEKYDCFSWAVQKREEGKIRHFGFSFHGTPKKLTEILDRHPEVEFVQIQLNYLDWDSEEVCSGELYRILTERKIPIVVMEPIKGGNLAKLRDDLEGKLKAVTPDRSIASFALRFVGSLPGVMTLLSGMSLLEQMEDNVSTFTDFKPLNEEEKKAIEEVVSIMRKTPQIGCTGCSYCTDGCPMNVGIPNIFRIVNAINMYGRSEKTDRMIERMLEKKSGPADCIACGQCEGVCPQHLNIIELLQDATQYF